MASLFIALHHNVTLSVPAPTPSGGTQNVDMVFYTNGLKDIPAIFFYLLISVVMHQIIQVRLVDPISRRNPPCIEKWRKNEKRKICPLHECHMRGRNLSSVHIT